MQEGCTFLFMIISTIVNEEKKIIHVNRFLLYPEAVVDSIFSYFLQTMSGFLQYFKLLCDTLSPVLFETTIKNYNHFKKGLLMLLLMVFSVACQLCILRLKDICSFLGKLPGPVYACKNSVYIFIRLIELQFRKVDKPSKKMKIFKNQWPIL